MENPQAAKNLNYSFDCEKDQSDQDSPLYHSKINSDLVNSSFTNTTVHHSPFSKYSPSPTRYKLLNSSFLTVNDKPTEFALNKSVISLSEKFKEIEDEHQNLNPAKYYVGYSKKKEDDLRVSVDVSQAEYLDYSKGNLEIPTLMWCAYCKGEMSTEISYTNSSKTFLSSLGIFLSGGIFGCFLLPYMSNSCKSPTIICKKCGRTLGN